MMVATMCELRIIAVLMLLSCAALEVLSNNFRGGIIMVKPKAGGAVKEMEISYYVSWEQDDTSRGCNSSAIENGDLLDGSDSIDCLYSCSGVITKLSYVCTCYSAEDNWSFGKNQLTHVFKDTTDINTVTIGSIGGFWSSEISGTWNISTTFSLATRSDIGKINSSPRAVTVPLLRLQEGCEHTIPLGVSDPDNDTIRCRWAVGEECKGICNQFPGAFLDSNSCTIKYHANYGAGIKAVAVMIEDYAPGSSHPLSSVSLQFLVEVFSSPQPCSVNIDYFKPIVSMNSSDGVIIKPHSESVNVTLTCTTNGGVSYYWERQNGSIPTDTIGVNTSNLTFIDIQMEDTGNYRCVVTNHCGVTSYSDYSLITIIEDKCSATSHYHLGFFYNYNGGTLSFILTTTELQPVSYSIEAPSRSYTYSGIVTANNSVVVNLPSGLQTSSYYHWNYGIYLQTSSDKVTVTGQSYTSHTSDTYLALPTIDLKITEYIYYGMSVYSPSYSSIVLIVGTESNTRLKLTVTQTTYVSTRSSSYYRRRVYSGSQYSFTINRLQTMYIADDGDLSGTKIVTNKPVSVFSGHRCASVPNGYGNCGYLIEQIPPTTYWGKVYYVAPLATRRSYTIKVLAAYDSTYVTINCNATVLSYSLNEQGHVTRTLVSQEYCVIKANKDVLVAQFSGRNGEDPSMTLVSPNNNFVNKFKFSTFHYASQSNYYSSYINIIVMAQYYQPHLIHLITGGFKASLNTQEWTPFTVNNVIEAFATKVAILHGTIEIIHANITALMTTMVYGVAARNGYMHLGGLSSTAGIWMQIQSPLHSVELTNDLTLKCFTVGYNVSYQWIIRSRLFPSKITEVNENTLVIPDVRSSDENIYTCLATTTAGCAVSNPTQLIVIGLPSVTVTPSVQTVEITLTARFTATVTGVGPFTYQWERGDKVLTDETRNTYLVYNASQEDQNYYRCIVTNKFAGSTVSNRFWLQVTRNPPHFTKHPMSQVVGLKSNFTNISLTCEAEGASTYRWERQYDSIPSSAIGVNTNTLMLINLQLKDAGQYRCVATNSSGSTESDYAVLFLRASSSTFVTHPADTSAAAPFSGIFTCSAYGYGKQHITWHKTSGKLPHKHMIKQTASPRTVTSTLTIANVTEQDVGKYYCQVWANHIGSQSKRANLHYSGIPPKPEVKMQPGQFINLTVNNFILSMKCTSYADGFGYKWEKKNAKNIPRAQDINARQLTITNLKTDDSGEYRCIISNSTGVIISGYSLLTVQVALPVITRQPSSIVVRVFNIASFECTARSYGDVSITWKRLNSELPITANITVSRSLNEVTSVLRLESVGYYEGYYYCEIKNSAGIVNSELAHYEISVPCPEMILKPEPIKVRPDTTVTFSCVAWSYGGLMYEWSKNDSLTLPFNSTVFYEDKPLPANAINTTMYGITIFNIQETDEGHYCCVASNGCGSTTKCTWLEVDTSPIITVQPMSRTFKHNKRNVSAFQIIATGVGHVYYLWQKYDSFTDSWVPLSSRAVNDTSPNLNFSTITEEDQGIYHCIVKNYDGSVTSDNASITVFAAPNVTYYSPAIVVFEGNKVDLICNATNDVDAINSVQVSWYYRGMLIKPDGKYVMINNIRNNATDQIHSVLSFNPVNYTNDGVYTCRAFNQLLSFTENNIKLTVEYPPRVNLNPPGPTYTVSVGTRLFLYCVATGLPPPTIQWYQNDVLIPQQSSPLFLAFTNIPQVTQYTCEAKNNAGNMENTARKSITVTVRRNGCPSLADPENGKVFQFSDGNAAIFSCNDGYTKKGESFLSCINGNWSSPAPTCLKSQ